MNRANITLASTVVAAALGWVLGLSAVPSVSYACNLGFKHNDPGVPCGGDGGGDPEEIATNDTMVMWVGAGLSEAGPPRLCHFSFAKRDGKTGSYGCVHSGDDGVIFNLADGVELDKRGNPVSGPPGICDLFSDGLMMKPNYAYESDWNGFCMSPDGCDVRVLNGFSYDKYRPPGTGLIKLEAFGKAFETPNANPFAEDLDIDIDEVLITIKGDGSDKTVAICQYKFPDTTFESTPVL